MVIAELRVWLFCRNYLQYMNHFSNHCVRRRSYLPRNMEHERYRLLMQDLEDTITCQVCFQRMEKPKMLSCLHSFCLVCITEMPLVENSLLHCPVCREKSVVPRMDTGMLPTPFLVNQLSDIIVKHEKMIKQSQKTVKAKKQDDTSKNSVNISECINEQQAISNASESEVKLEWNSSKVERSAMRKQNASFQTPMRPMKEEESKTNARYHVQIEKSSSCVSDKHVFMVKEMSKEYKAGNQIQLKLWKFCSKNSTTPCCAWGDRVDGALVHTSGRIVNFCMARLADGGWLLSCHANEIGNFRVIVKVNDKPIKTIELRVEACK